MPSDSIKDTTILHTQQLQICHGLSPGSKIMSKKHQPLELPKDTGLSFPRPLKNAKPRRRLIHITKTKEDKSPNQVPLDIRKQADGTNAAADLIWPMKTSEGWGLSEHGWMRRIRNNSSLSWQLKKQSSYELKSLKASSRAQEELCDPNTWKTATPSAAPTSPFPIYSTEKWPCTENWNIENALTGFYGRHTSHQRLWN